jgi:para-nitrobenzyl esterase
VSVTTAALALAAACSDDGGGSSGDSGTSDRASGGTDPLVVATDLGDARGSNSAVAGVTAFLALPYAAPPTGDNQWRPPQPPDPYDGILDATIPGGACPQDPDAPLAAITPIPDVVEDCLTLNVWAPDDADDLPVMFWIHGGGLSTGSAHQSLYIGDDLAAEGVVVVSANYRVGPFGFLATDELAAESDDGSFGNYGLADQVAALEWVQRNVGAFGGDPENVTIFGESAGGFSVCGHLASEASGGLFERVIVQSGGGCGRLADGADARAAGAAFLDSLGCTDIACLRALPVETVAGADFDPSLVADGVTLTETAAELAAEGDLDDVPVIIGSNETEATLFTIGMAEPADDELAGLFATVTDDPEALLALYPPTEYESNLERYRTMLTEARFTCPTLAFAGSATNPTYVYHYMYESPDDPFGLGPTHGAELVPLFAHPEGIVGLEEGLAGVDAQVSDEMQAAWVAFATAGEPGDRWRPYGDGQQVTIIDDPTAQADSIRGGRCEQVTALSTLSR